MLGIVLLKIWISGQTIRFSARLSFIQGLLATVWKAQLGNFFFLLKEDKNE